jgi:hypothetical protein
MIFENFPIILFFLSGMVLGVAMVIFQLYRNEREKSWANARQFQTEAAVFRGFTENGRYFVVARVIGTLFIVEAPNVEAWIKALYSKNLYVTYKVRKRSGEIGMIEAVADNPSDLEPRQLDKEKPASANVIFLPGRGYNVH